MGEAEENTMAKLKRLLHGTPKAKRKARSGPIMYQPVFVEGDVHFTDVKKEENGTLYYISIIVGIIIVACMLGSYLVGKQNCWGILNSLDNWLIQAEWLFHYIQANTFTLFEF